MSGKAIVKVVHTTASGLNDVLNVNGINMTNNQVYNAAKAGKIPGYNGVKNDDGTKYIRSNPDGNKNNNLG